MPQAVLEQPKKVTIREVPPPEPGAGHRSAPLITHRFPFREYGAAYGRIERNRNSTMKVLIDREG